MKYKLAIFDMDGTILDTLNDLKDSLNYVLNMFGMPTRTLEEVRSFIGNGIRLLIERGVPKNTPSEQTDKVFKMFNEYYAVHCADTTKPYDGIEKIILKLKENGIKVAVVSNKSDYAVQSLCKQYFDGLFDFAVGACEGVRKKPYPDTVNKVLKKFDISKDDAVYIGDSEVDVETAQNAEMDCISVDWGYRDRDVLINAGAKLIVSDTANLLKEIIG